jgi:hypothetical protein
MSHAMMVHTRRKRGTRLRIWWQSLVVVSQKARLLARCCRVAEPLVDAEGDVVVPAGALAELLVGRQSDLAVRHAPVVSSVAAALTLSEATVRISELTRARRPRFAPAPIRAIADFRAFVLHGRAPYVQTEAVR